MMQQTDAEMTNDKTKAIIMGGFSVLMVINALILMVFIGGFNFAFENISIIFILSVSAAWLFQRVEDRNNGGTE